MQIEAGLADIERTHGRIAPETERTHRRREGLAYGDSETESGLTDGVVAYRRRRK